MHLPITALICLGIFVALCTTAAADSSEFMTAAQESAMYDAPERVFSYSNQTQNSPGVLATSPYGYLKGATSSSFPFLTTMSPGMSQLLFTVEPCSQFAPHIHPRADELLQLISGGPVKGGLIDEFSNGTQALYPYSLNQYDFTVFPTGLAHFVYNDACETATILATFDNVDPGTVLLMPTALTLPNLALQGTWGIGSSTLATIKGMIKEQTLFMSLNDPECYKRCNITAPSS